EGHRGRAPAVEPEHGETRCEPGGQGMVPRHVAGTARRRIHQDPAPEERRRGGAHAAGAPSSSSPAYAFTGGQTQTRFRSPQAFSTRLTGGQNLWVRVQGAGKAASLRP